MTEKRFECNENKIIDNCTNGVTECKNSNEAYLLCNFLNEQDKTIEKQKLIIAEIEELKQRLKNKRIEWALNQFRYMGKTSEQRDAFIIIENELNKRYLND